MSNESDDFSCFQNVSSDSLHETEWNVNQPGDPFSATTNGYIVSSFMLLFLLVGLPWNIMVVAIILKKHLFMQPVVMLMLNLAVSNFLIYFFVMPYNIITGFAGEYVFGGSDSSRCRVCQTGVAIVLFPIVSTHTLSLMSVDRFIYLKKPLTYHLIITPLRMLAAIIGIWVLSILLSLPPLFGFGQVRFSHTVATCVVFIDRETHIAPNYLYVILLLAEGALPFLILCVMYVWIIFITRKHLMINLRRSLATSHTSQQQHAVESRSGILKEHSRHQLHLVQVFSAVFTSNIVTWLPLIPLVISVAVLEPGGVPTVVFSLAYLIYMSSTVIHPILQSYLIHDIRTAMVSCFKMTRLCKKKPHSSNSSIAA